MAFWLAYFFKFDLNWSRLKFSLTFGIAGTLTGVWSLLSARVIGPAAAPLWQRLLHSPVRGHTEDIGADGMMFPEIVAFISAYGMVCLALSVAAILAVKSSEVEGRRRFWRGTLGLVMVGGVAAGSRAARVPDSRGAMWDRGRALFAYGYVEDPNRLFLVEPSR